MYNYITAVNHALGRKALAEEEMPGLLPLNFFAKSFFCINDDLRAAKSLLQLDAWDRILGKSSYTGLYSVKGLLYIASLNGVVVIDYPNQLVYKILLTKFEPNFIDNEVSANSICSKHTPKVVNYFFSGDCSVVVQRMIQGRRRKTWKRWGSVLERVFPLLMTQKNSPIRLSSVEYVTEIKESLSRLDHSPFSSKSHGTTKANLIFLLQKYSGSFSQYQLFSHGDLTPNNVMEESGRHMLIDFANGGQLSFSYDLMLQDFYFTKKSTWKNFDKIKFKKNQDSNIFFGKSSYFFSHFEKEYNVNLTESLIKLSLIISLSEIYIKNYLRHQSDKEWKDGEAMLKNVDDICRSIKLS